MRVATISQSILFFAAILSASAVSAKDGVRATLHTPLLTHIAADTEIRLEWSLEDEHSGAPFSACKVFIRLIGPNGDSAEAFAGCGHESSMGRYQATVSVPKGGISNVEIGIAGTVTDREGNRERSDWIVPMSNEGATRSSPTALQNGGHCL